MALSGSVAVKLGAVAKLETILERATKLSPGAPEPWFDLAVIKTSLNKLPEAFSALSNCLEANAKRSQLSPGASSIASNIQNEPRLAALRSQPEYQAILSRMKTLPEKAN